MRIEPPAVPQTLNRLATDKLVFLEQKRWTLTPRGTQQWRELLGEIDVDAVEADIVGSGSAEFSRGQHPLIPPELAPIKWARPIGSLLDQFPFESNVFLMTRFPEDAREDSYPDPVREVVSACRQALAAHGLHLHLASDRNVEDELFGNVAAHMWACKYGVALFETRFSDHYNLNLQIEVGAMLMTGRRCALLRDVGTPKMPTDLVGHIYKEVNFQDLSAVSAAAHSWSAHDLALGECVNCI